MDFAPSARSDELKARLVEFDDEIVRPAEPSTATSARSRAIRTSRRRSWRS